MCRFKDGKALKANAKCVMSVDKEDVTLTLQNTEMNDAGTYKVEASNKLGSVNTECTVDVQGLHEHLVHNSVIKCYLRLTLFSVFDICILRLR